MPPILRVALQKCEQLLSFLLVSFESLPTHKPVTEMSSCAHQSTEQQHHAVRSFARPTGAVRTGARHHFGRGSKPASQPKPTHSVRPQNTTCTSAAPSAAALTLPAVGGCDESVTENIPMTITPLTPESLRAAARTAAELHQSRAEANHYEIGTELWHQFNDAFREAEHAIHHARRVQEVAA